MMRCCAKFDQHPQSSRAARARSSTPELSSNSWLSIKQNHWRPKGGTPKSYTRSYTKDNHNRNLTHQRAWWTKNKIEAELQSLHFFSRNLQPRTPPNPERKTTPSRFEKSEESQDAESFLWIARLATQGNCSFAYPPETYGDSEAS